MSRCRHSTVDGRHRWLRASRWEWHRSDSSAWLRRRESIATGEGCRLWSVCQSWSLVPAPWWDIECPRRANGYRSREIWLLSRGWSKTVCRCEMWNDIPDRQPSRSVRRLYTRSSSCHRASVVPLRAGRGWGGW